jgi:LPPG:FO 2-phospho-L-lactate transferase
VIAVSPIIGGEAVKGPTAKMMAELGMPTTPQGVAEHYKGLLDGLVVDEADAADAARIDLPCLITPTLMRSENDKKTLAANVLDFAGTLRGQGQGSA